MKTKGSCLCGQVRFEIATTPETYMEHCHCSMCRKAHGASFVTWIDVPTGDFALLSGEGDVARFRSSPDWTRAFCRHCGSSLFGQRDGSPWISIAAGVLDGDPGCRPSVHIFVASRAPWVTPEAGLPQYDERRLRERS
jgi:hypothetical protein